MAYQVEVVCISSLNRQEISGDLWDYFFRNEKESLGERTEFPSPVAPRKPSTSSEHAPPLRSPLKAPLEEALRTRDASSLNSTSRSKREIRSVA
eukprot:1357173-Amorphochlora_amoeboformis.AAC.2